MNGGWAGIASLLLVWKKILSPSNSSAPN